MPPTDDCQQIFTIDVAGLFSCICQRLKSTSTPPPVEILGVDFSEIEAGYRFRREFKSLGLFAIVGEFVGGDGGLGYQLMVANGSMNTPLLFAGIGALTLLGVLFFWTIELLERIARTKLQNGRETRDWRCSIWQSISNCEDATLSP